MSRLIAKSPKMTPNPIGRDAARVEAPCCLWTVLVPQAEKLRERRKSREKQESTQQWAFPSIIVCLNILNQNAKKELWISGACLHGVPQYKDIVLAFNDKDEVE